jgi:predicted nuclease with RNAse H fold
MRIIGIDLAGTEKGYTGFALIDNKLTTWTSVLRTDDEIKKATLAEKGLITIDAPLGIPKGRCCLDYNCACRKFGCARVGERQLMRMGIKVFPCGFGGMQKLTMRGIALKKFFEGKGRDVIETYPGSAQDLLEIPRKGKDHRKLQRALIKYGFKGDVRKKDITDHELDAITSALVGKLYLKGDYLAIGIPEEQQIITARPKGNITRFFRE